MANYLLRISVGLTAWLLVAGQWQSLQPLVAQAQEPAPPESAAVPSGANAWTNGVRYPATSDPGLRIHSPVETRDVAGFYALAPSVEVLPGASSPSPWRPTQIASVPADESGSVSPGPELPGGLLPEPIADDGLPESVFGDVLRQEWAVPERPGFWAWLQGRRRGISEPGIGTEYVATAPLEIEITQPLNALRVRIDSVQNFSPPDRAEYLWARPKSDGGRGPDLPLTGLELVDYQDLRFQMEVGGEKFSVGTEIPIRIMDPLTNANTAGMGDMSLTTKTVLCDGVRWQISQLFRTYFNTGAPSKGLGNGHISMQPGMLARFKINDRTYVHSEIDYWFPIAGHPEHSGQVLRWGVGVSRVWRDSDSLALIPTFEILGLSALDGMQSGLFEQAVVLRDIDSRVGLWAIPGLRTVIDTGGDLGVIEIGVAGGLDIGSSGWHDGMLRFEIRRQF
ncbi:MAG: hypothetical protein MUE50_03190 [Pirellulaceae bacterium]|nr:hypothetical protein [Pirellulaceae bacterium]